MLAAVAHLVTRVADLTNEIDGESEMQTRHSVPGTPRWVTVAADNINEKRWLPIFHSFPRYCFLNIAFHKSLLLTLLNVLFWSAPSRQSACSSQQLSEQQRNASVQLQWEFWPRETSLVIQRDRAPSSCLHGSLVTSEARVLPNPFPKPAVAAALPDNRLPLTRGILSVRTNKCDSYTSVITMEI